VGFAGWDDLALRAGAAARLRSVVTMALGGFFS